jgi:hypothetical protein
MKYWFFMLLRPMLFIDTIAICSWDTCTTDMLVTIHKRQFKKKNNNTYKQLGRSENNVTNARGRI